MENTKVRIDQSVLIDYVFDNLIAIQNQILNEYSYSSKVETNNDLILGILFSSRECKIFHYDAHENILKNLLIRSYNDFIADNMINKFKQLRLPEYMLRFQRCDNDKLREQIVDFLILGKIKVRFNPYYGNVECYWKKARISFLVNPESNQLYEVIQNNYD